ncbi:stage II sporulation protein D [Geomicrobium sp. JCM 19055]|uniref:stage II sporulation protein D n=1 Tax=Geomicrobium sp. JCM 19055 TaxID=1460649 RepID=UPI00045ECC33|nr:stage II sporulation protein D [Geomicrobium sp. JCM 19055]GAJ97325.1 stage II sporulation protein D [Geomicrobium sp. JCM 19055]
MKQIFVVISVLTSVCIVLPAVLVMLFSDSRAATDLAVDHVTEDQEERAEEEVGKEEVEEVFVPVYRDASETVQEVELEQYVAGVVASEMPASFEMEALKAQALVARTFVVKQMENEENIQLPEGALVTDTTSHQVYHSNEELQELWGSDYDEKMERIQKAVYATKGEVITHEGTPITASFFSTSNGYTENAEDYWANELPYLKSVESPWDQNNSPRFTNTVRIPVSDAEAKLGVSIPATEEFAPITERTEGGRVQEVTISGETFHGREIREALGLDSSDFSWHREADELVVSTKGWGHGVGMSQYGADGMAKSGNSYEEIVAHYYQEIQIENHHSQLAQYALNTVEEDE